MYCSNYSSGPIFTTGPPLQGEKLLKGGLEYGESSECKAPSGKLSPVVGMLAHLLGRMVQKEMGREKPKPPGSKRGG